MGKKMTVKYKILSFLEQTGTPKEDFYKKIGVAPSNFKGVGLNSGLGGDKIVKILTLYPELSADWLLRDEGEMLRGFPDTNKENGQKNEEKDEKFLDLPKVSYEIGRGTPYYDVDFIGGFSEIFNSQVTVPACNVVVPGFEKASLWCNVTGHSMEPKINHGDIIALRECAISDIQYGEIYAVVLDTLRTIKILRRGSTPDVLRFVPINIQNFDEQEFPLSRILHIFEVLGSVARFF